MTDRTEPRAPAASERVKPKAPSRFAPRARAMVFAALLPVLLFAPVLLSGSGSFYIFPDARDQTFAWLQKTAICIHQGYLPLWDASTMSGHSFVGEFQSGVFYPLNVLWLALFGSAGGLALSAAEGLAVLHFSLAAAGMYLLLSHWELDRMPAICGAATFALLGALPSRALAQPNIFFGLCLLPFAVWMALRHRDGAHWGWAFGAGGMVGLQVLAGHVQPAFHTALLVAAAYLGDVLQSGAAMKARARRLLVASVAAAAGVALTSGFQLVLGLQYLEQAYRWVGNDTPVRPGEPIPYSIFGYRYMLAPRDFLSLFDPWAVDVEDANTLYFGTLPLLLVAGMLALRRRLTIPKLLRREGKWMALVAAFAVVAMLGHYTPLARVLHKLPFIGEIRELGRYAILFHFVAAVATAAAVQAFRDAPSRLCIDRKLAALGAAGTVLAAWLLGFAGLSRTAALHLLVAAAAALLILAWPRLRRDLPVAAVVLVLVHASAFSVPRLSAIPRRDVTAAFDTGSLAPLLRRTWGYGRVLLDQGTQLSPNVADAGGFESKMGHGATLYRPFFDFVSSDWALDSRVNDALNVRYVLSKRELPLATVARDDAIGLTLYERPQAFPRVFLGRQIASGERVSAEDIGLELLHYSDHVQRFRLRAEKDDFAVASEIAYPGWCARVNGEPVEIKRAALGALPALFRAVRVRAGENVIEFRYRPFRAMLFGCS